jgi:hypothetical protein
MRPRIASVPIISTALLLFSPSWAMEPKQVAKTPLGALLRPSGAERNKSGTTVGPHGRSY